MSDPWRVTRTRVGDGHVIHLHLGDVMVMLPALEAHKLGSALHAASGLDMPGRWTSFVGPVPMTYYVYDADVGWIAVCRECGNGPLTGLHERAGRCDEHLEPRSSAVVFAQIAHYYSTACLHLTHDACRQTCKFCDQRCRCDCHVGDQPEGQSDGEG